MPTDEDILASRVRTCGIVEEHYVIDDVTFVVIDVGGQRNERKKSVTTSKHPSTPPSPRRCHVLSPERRRRGG